VPENQQPPGLAAAHEVREVARGTIAEVRVVRTDLLAAGGDQEIFAWIRPREGLATRGVARRLRVRAGSQPAVEPAGRHEVD